MASACLACSAALSRPALGASILAALPALAAAANLVVERPAPLPEALAEHPQLPALVLVLPFTARGDTEPAWLSAGAARGVAEGIRAAGYRVVDEREGMAAVHGSGLAGEPRLTLASACRLGRDVGARHVVQGSWVATGQHLELAARVVDVERLKLLREARAAGSCDAPGGALGELVEELTGASGRSAAWRDVVAQFERTPSPAIVAWLQAAAEPEQAEAHLRAAVEAAPGLVPARLALGELLLDAGRAEEVGAILEPLGRPSAAHHRAAVGILRGRMHLALGDHAGAIGTLSQAADDQAGSAALLWLAEAQLAAGERVAAARTARRCLDLAPADPDAVELLRRTHASVP